jgi:hypothetical protein
VSPFLFNKNPFLFSIKNLCLFLLSLVLICCFRPNQRFCLTPAFLFVSPAAWLEAYACFSDRFYGITSFFPWQYFLLLGGSAVLFPICFFPLPPVWRPTLWYPEGCSWFRSCWYLRFLWEHDMPRRHAMLRPGSRARRGALRRHPTLSPARAYTCSLMSSL